MRRALRLIFLIPCLLSFTGCIWERKKTHSEHRACNVEDYVDPKGALQDVHSFVVFVSAPKESETAFRSEFFEGLRDEGFRVYTNEENVSINEKQLQGSIWIQWNQIQGAITDDQLDSVREALLPVFEVKMIVHSPVQLIGNPSRTLANVWERSRFLKEGRDRQESAKREMQNILNSFISEWKSMNPSSAPTFYEEGFFFQHCLPSKDS